MKILIAAVALLFCGPAFADCPDFRGDYKWTDPLEEGNFIKISITQTECSFLQEEHDQGWGFKVKHKHVIDGEKRLVEDNGDFKAYETARMDSTGLHIMEERHKLYEEPPVTEYMQIDILHPAADQLVIKRVKYDADMKPVDEDKTIYLRQ